MLNINPLSGLFSGASSQLQKTNTNIQNTIASLVTGNANTQAGQDVANTAIAVQLQSQVSTLKQASTNVSQSLSVTQTAGDAINQELNIISQLQQLSAQGNNGALNDSERKGLNTQFQGLVQQLDQIAGGTSFNGQNLLNGSYSTSINQALGTNGNADETLSVPDLSSQTLFNGATPNLLSQAGAQNAQDLLQTASNTLQSAQSDVGSFSQALGFASASIESMLFNQSAASSTLSDEDFAQGATQLSQLNLQQNAQIALQAQTQNIPASVLDLLNNPNT